MSQFQFKLEKVLEYRRNLEEEAMHALAEAQAARDFVLNRRKELQGELLETDAKLCSGGALDGAERWLLMSYRSAMQSDINYCADQLKILEPEVERRRLVLIEKAQERQLLDKLKEKQAQRHALEEKNKEQREYDEIATLRFRPQAI